MTAALTPEEQNELRGLYSKLSNLYREKAKLEVVKKGREEALKEEMASVCQIKNKKGEIQSSKVKMPLINAILDGLYRDKHNKKEEEIGIYEEYKQVIKNKEVNEDCIKAYLNIDESIKENVDFIKETYKESSILSKETLDALNMLLKEAYKLYLNDELNQSGYEVKESNDKEEVLELKEIIKQLVNEENK